MEEKDAMEWCSRNTAIPLRLYVNRIRMSLLFPLSLFSASFILFLSCDIVPIAMRYFLMFRRGWPEKAFRFATKFGKYLFPL